MSVMTFAAPFSSLPNAWKKRGRKLLSSILVMWVSLALILLKRFSWTWFVIWVMHPLTRIRKVFLQLAKPSCSIAKKKGFKVLPWTIFILAMAPLNWLCWPWTHYSIMAMRFLCLHPTIHYGRPQFLYREAPHIIIYVMRLKIGRLIWIIYAQRLRRVLRQLWWSIPIIQRVLCIQKTFC